MKAKADTDDGYFKFADELLKDLVLADLTLYELKACLLVIGHTYARKVRAKGQNGATPLKVTPRNIYALSKAGALDTGGLRRSLRKLVAQGVLLEDAHGRIGMNTRAASWRVPIADGGWDTGVRGASGWGDTHPRGRTSPGTPIPQIGDPHPLNGGPRSPKWGTPIPHPPYARAGELESRRGGERDTTPPNLPNGKKDTPRQRALLGHPDYAPDEHPDFKPLLYQIQRELLDAWKAKQKSTASTARLCASCTAAPAIPGARFCPSCAWCVDCDAAGEASPAAVELVLGRDGRGRCRAHGGKSGRSGA